MLRLQVFFFQLPLFTQHILDIGLMGLMGGLHDQIKLEKIGPNMIPLTMSFQFRDFSTFSNCDYFKVNGSVYIVSRTY